MTKEAALARRIRLSLFGGHAPVRSPGKSVRCGDHGDRGSGGDDRRDRGGEEAMAKTAAAEAVTPQKYSGKTGKLVMPSPRPRGRNFLRLVEQHRDRSRRHAER